MHLESKTKQKKVTKTTHQITELRKPRNPYNQTNHVNIIDGRLAISEGPNFSLSLSLSLSLSRRKVWHFSHLFSPLLELLQNLALFNETLGVTIAEYCACLSRVLRPQLKMLLS